MCVCVCVCVFESFFAFGSGTGMIRSNLASAAKSCAVLSLIHGLSSILRVIVLIHTYVVLVRAPDSSSKGREFESWQERRENVLLQSQLCVLTLIR